MRIDGFCLDKGKNTNNCFFFFFLKIPFKARKKERKKKKKEKKPTQKCLPLYRSNPMSRSHEHHSEGSGRRALGLLLNGLSKRSSHWVRDARGGDANAIRVDLKSEKSYLHMGKKILFASAEKKNKHKG